MKLVATENTSQQTPGVERAGRGGTAEEIFADPVRYLAGFGIDARLVRVTDVRVSTAA